MARSNEGAHVTVMGDTVGRVKRLGLTQEPPCDVRVTAQRQ